MTGGTGAALRAVLFDKDGTLFSFNATWTAYCERIFDRLAGPDERVRDRLAQACGYDRRQARFRPGSQIVAGSTDEVLRIWAEILERTDMATVRQAHDHAVIDLPLEAVPGGQAALQRLRDCGVALGVATNDTESSARDQLDRAGLADLFLFVAGSDSGYGAKPGPGMAEGFCKACGVDAGETAMVGDSLHDLEFARQAGHAQRIAVLSGPAGREELAAQASAVLPDISHLPAFLGLD